MRLALPIPRSKQGTLDRNALACHPVREDRSAAFAVRVSLMRPAAGCRRASTITAGRTRMKRIPTMLAAAACAAALASPAALAQPAELSLTRLDCGTPQAPTPVNQ